MMIASRWVWIASLCLSLPVAAGDFDRWEQAAEERVPWQAASTTLPVDALNEQGRSIAHLAARHGRLDWLERMPASLLGQPDDLDNLPLHSAAWAGRLDALIWLKDHGADLSAANRQGWQALHMAVFNGHGKMVRWLLRQQVPVNAVTHDGWTPLGLAVGQNACALVPDLLAAGADPSEPVRVYGRTLTPAELAHALNLSECERALSQKR